MLTYVGKGYSPAFVANLDQVVARLATGERAVIHEGPDDICRPLLATDEPHCRRDSIMARDAKALREVSEALGRRLQAGDVVPTDDATLDRLRAAFLRGATRSACAGCEWFELCSKVADGGFATTALRRPPDAASIPPGSPPPH